MGAAILLHLIYNLSKNNWSFLDLFNSNMIEIYNILGIFVVNIDNTSKYRLNLQS